MSKEFKSKPKKERIPSEGGTKLSLHPLDFETALGAALKTGGPPPPPKPKIIGRAVNRKMKDRNDE